jgi:UDP-3-O-[3-hydroxymyristoyl] N-acetylglucosamine deacetylase
MIYQKTISREIEIKGTGLHSGNEVRMLLKPAEADTGIVFNRTDVSESKPIRIAPDSVFSTVLCTTVGSGENTVSTVEHFLSAIRGLGIDNMSVEIDGPEVPILDGCAGEFVDTVKKTGLTRLGMPKKVVVIKKPVFVSDEGRWVGIVPSDAFRISYTIDFKNPAIGVQAKDISFTDGQYDREISRARTFGFLEELSWLRDNNLGKGGRLENAIIVGENGIVNEDGLRFPDEFVRHKILDSIGDLSMVGYPVIGHFVAFKSGHALNQKLVQELMSRPDSWEIVELTGQEETAGYPPFGKLNRLPA